MDGSKRQALTMFSEVQPSLLGSGTAATASGLLLKEEAVASSVVATAGPEATLQKSLS